MSTRPHMVLSWALRRTRLPLGGVCCVHCHSGLAGPGDGKFPVNADGNLLDTLLPVACVSCDRTSAFPDRVPVRYLDPILLRRYSGVLVARVLPGSLIAWRNRFALQWDSCRELLAPWACESRPWPVQVLVIVGDAVPVRPGRLVLPGSGHQLRGDRAPHQDRRSVELQKSAGLLVRPVTDRRRGPRLGREARWPCPGLPHAAVRARSLTAGGRPRSGSARYRRRR